MPKLRNGTVMILIGTQKVFDLKVTSTWPMIATAKKLLVGRSVAEAQPAPGYQHLSIPPDLQIHLTGNKHRWFLRRDVLERSSGNLQRPFDRLFAWVSSEPQLYRQPIGKWHGAAILSPFEEADQSPATRLCVEVFANDRSDLLGLVSCQPPHQGCRPAATRSGPWFPFSYADALRRPLPKAPTFLMSLRMSYIDLPTLPGDTELLLVDDLSPPR